jgi:Tfp pilus assembly protein PilF
MIRRALELSPGNGYITDSLGWLYFKKGDMALAEKYLKDATALVPRDPLIMEHLGDVYEKKGALAEARETYERALKLSPDSESVKKKLERLPKKTR